VVHGLFDWREQLNGSIWKLPLWPIFALACSPGIVAAVRWLSRKAHSKRRRGFPVELKATPVDPIVRQTVPATAPKSRGALVSEFVLGTATPIVHLDLLRTQVGDYGPFNLVVGDAEGVYALGSAEGLMRRLKPGVHVISNGALGVHWPKTERLQRRFADATRSGAVHDEASLLDLLRDETPPPDEDLPDTGVGLELERRLAPIFIHGGKYGTRACSLVVRHADGSVALRERRFGPDAHDDGEDRWAALPGGPFESTAAF
jgi:uncharacterized protein with NRDE domain